MLQFLKNTAVILLLAAFLAPATGVMVFMHQCRAMETLELSLDGTSSCCSSGHDYFNQAETPVCGEASFSEHACTHNAHISKQSCCEDSRLFVKISDNYLTASGHFFQADKVQLELFHFTGAFLFPVVSLPLFAKDSPDPPGNDTWLLVSSLRL